MRVVHLIDSGGFYGAEVMLLNLCVEQKKQGLNVEVISIGTPNQTIKSIEQKLEEAKIPFIPWRMRALPDLRESFKILKHCKDTNSDIIHSHGYKGNILMGLIPKRLRRIPVVSTVHGYTKQNKFGKMALNQWLDKNCLHRLDAVVLVSPSMKHQIPAKRLQHNLHIVPNGIPELNESTDLTSYQSLFSTNNFKIGALGRLSYEKNFSLLIHSMPEILKSIPNAKLVIYGEGGERHYLEELIQSLKLTDNVLLPGYLNNTQSFFSEIDVFVNSSITEGMPISLLEAMRQGCHIVATDIPASRFLLNELNSIDQLCDLTSDSLSKSIIQLFSSNDAQKEKISAAYKNNFQEKYTVALMAKNYQHIYNVTSA